MFLLESGEQIHIKYSEWYLTHKSSIHSICNDKHHGDNGNDGAGIQFYNYNLLKNVLPWAFLVSISPMLT
jgi:hypothetical protein